MKTMTCKQLGGACNLEFHADTFKEIAQMSKNHGLEMFKKGDVPHLQAMEQMQQKTQNPEEMQKWMVAKQKEFEALDSD